MEVAVRFDLSPVSRADQFVTFFLHLCGVQVLPGADRVTYSQVLLEKHLGGQMDLDKDKIVTQDELNEPAPIDQVEERVDAEMKKLEGEAKRQVADGLDDEKLAREGERLKKEGDRELDAAKGE